MDTSACVDDTLYFGSIVCVCIVLNDILDCGSETHFYTTDFTTYGCWWRCYCCCSLLHLCFSLVSTCNTIHPHNVVCGKKHFIFAIIMTNNLLLYLFHQFQCYLSSVVFSINLMCHSFAFLSSIDIFINTLQDHFINNYAAYFPTECTEFALVKMKVIHEAELNISFFFFAQKKN